MTIQCAVGVTIDIIGARSELWLPTASKARSRRRPRALDVDQHDDRTLRHTRAGRASTTPPIFMARTVWQARRSGGLEATDITDKGLISAIYLRRTAARCRCRSRIRAAVFDLLETSGETRSTSLDERKRSSPSSSRSAYSWSSRRFPRVAIRHVHGGTISSRSSSAGTKTNVVAHPFLTFAYRKNAAIGRNQRALCIGRTALLVQATIAAQFIGHFGPDLPIESSPVRFALLPRIVRRRQTYIADEVRDYCWPTMLQEHLASVAVDPKGFLLGGGDERGIGGGR